MEQYRNEGFQHEEASPEHHSATSSEHGMSAFGDTASMSVGEVGDVSTFGGLLLVCLCVCVCSGFHRVKVVALRNYC